jgi:hypothetical protein
MEHDSASYDSRDYADYNDYADYRRGVRGSGRGRRDRMSDGHYYEDDDEYEKELKLPKKIMHQWLKNLESPRGDRGPRFSKEAVMDLAEKMRIRFEDYDEDDLYLMVNVLYSDCTAFESIVPPEKELYYWIVAAKEWLEDPDSKNRGSEKVVSYYYCVANG